MRTRALVLLMWGSALRVSEALALEVGQVLQSPPASAARIGRIRGTGYLRATQSKRGCGEGPFVITKGARSALRPYLVEAFKRGWLPLEDLAGPLFITAKGGSHGRVGKRAAQTSWRQVQDRASVLEPYRFHDLRHDAVTRVSNRAGGDAYKVAAFARLQDIRTTAVYVHSDPVVLSKLAELADG